MMMDASPEAWCLVEMSTASWYVVVIILDVFSGREATQSYAFAYPPKPRGRHTQLVVGHSVVSGGGGEKGSLCKLLRGVI